MSVRTLGDLLESAIQGEISSQKFYRDSLDKTSDQDVKNFLNALIKEEEGHERILLSIKEMEIYDASIAVPESLLESTKQAHDIEIPELSAKADLAEIFEIALKRETKAHNTFKQMMESVADEELRGLFEKLAADEETHYKKIDIKYHALTGRMGYEA
jgi:rubrerythrin